MQRNTLFSCRQRRLRKGASNIEVLVAFTLLTSVLSLSTPLVVRHGRVLAAARHYRLAVDELSNQLERLAALPADEVESMLDDLTPSEFIAAALRGAKLSGKLEAGDIGHRLTLQMVWDEPGRAAAPVSMTGWLIPRSTPADTQSAQEAAP
jgi:hypothetical protein